jgi:hypothetical protein
MHYEFFVGPVNLEEVYPGIVERSAYFYTEEEDMYYILYKRREVQVVPFSVGWRTLDYDQEIEEYIRRFQPDLRFRSTLPVLSRKVKVERTWKPYHILWQDHEWLSLLMEEERIIGFYRGESYEDDLERRYSTHSNIQVSPEFRGRGLCKNFAQFTYDKLLTELSISYISINVASTLPTGACRCYVRAAKDLGLYTFGAFAWEDEYLLREVEDCNLGDLDFLIFTFLPGVDETMIEFSNM